MPTLRLFAAVREAAGTRTAEFQGATVGDIIDSAIAEFGADFAALVPYCSVLLGNEPADRSTLVISDEEIALLPPFSGG